MSINAALSNAYSGLNASSRMAEIISSNVANALNENYAQRRVELSADSLAGAGAGVKIDAIVRLENAVATSARRAADAAAGSSGTLATAYARMGEALGSEDYANSLAARAVDLEASLSEAVATPESGAALADVLAAAKSLSAQIVNIAVGNQQIRMDADGEIARRVDTVNAALVGIDKLNNQIQVLAAGGLDTSALMDQRKQLIDKISSMIPIKTVRRDNEQIAVFAANGVQLVDGAASQLGFSPTSVITSDLNVGNGTLSGLTLNGQPVSIGNDDGMLDGGSLAALFRVRDVIVPEASAKLDAFAADLIGRFQDPAVDPTVITGLPGLFTDAGNAFDITQIEGLSDRIAVNAAADPGLGGAMWRLRDGLYAAASGDAGNSAVLSAMYSSAQRAQLPHASSGTTALLNMTEFASEIIAGNGNLALSADEAATFDTARAAALKEAEQAAVGVDTDFEMQQLMLVEQAYSANARVMSVIDSLLRTLMEI